MRRRKLKNSIMKIIGGKARRVRNRASHSVQSKGRMKPQPSPDWLLDATRMPSEDLR